MYGPPAYVWALTVAGPAAVAAATCLALYSGAVRPGLGRKRAALLGGAAAVLLGGWLAATAVIAGHGWYRTLPWFPIAVAGFLGALLALSRVPVVARALAAPGMASRLVLPHAFRVAGVVFLLYLALGHLPALFATATVPLLFALHLTSLVTFARAPRPASSAVGPVISGATPRAAVTPGVASRAG